MNVPASLIVVESDRRAARTRKQCLETLGYTVAAIVPDFQSAACHTKRITSDLILAPLAHCGDHAASELPLPIAYPKDDSPRELVKAIEVTLDRRAIEPERFHNALCLQEQRFHALFDGALTWMWLLLPDGTVAEANRQVLSSANLSLDRILGELFWEGPWWNLDDTQCQRLRQSIETAASGQLVQSDIEFIRGRDGVPVTLDLSITPLHLPKTEAISLVVEGRDISHRIQAERHLHELNQNLEALIEERTNQLEDSVHRLSSEIQRRQRADAVLQNLAAGTAAVTGRDFFVVLVRRIATAIGVRHVFLSTFEGDSAVSLVLWSDGQICRNFHSSLSESPAAITREQGLCCYEDRVQSYFPNDPDLVSLNARSYLGVALCNASGQVIGHLCVIDSRPIPNLRDCAPLLQVFAARAAAEIDRVRATQALEASEARFRNLVEASPDWIWEIDDRGCFTYASPQVFELLGLTPESVLGRYAWDLMLPSDAQRAREEFLTFKHKPEPFRDREYCGCQRQGSEVAIEVSAVPLFDENHQFCGYRGIARDVTERQQAEHRLRSSYATNRALLGALPDLLLRIRRDGTIVNYHASDTKLLWADPNDFLGEHLSQFLPQELADRTQAAVARALDERSLQSLEYQLTVNDSLRYWEARISASAADETIVIIRDITEEQQAEIALQQSRTFLKLVIDNIPQAIFWKDRNLVYQGCNRTFARDAGLDSPEAIVGKTEADLPWKPEEREAFEAHDGQVVETQTAQYHCLEVQHTADDREVWCETNRIPLPDENGEVIGVLGTYEDITARRRTEALLSQQSRAMEAAQDGIALLDAGGGYVYLNPAHLKIYGYDRPQDLLGKTWRTLYDPEQIQYLEQEALPKLQQDGKWRGEIPGRRQDDSMVPTEISLTALEDGGIICIARDLSERYLAERALRESQQRLQAILDNTPSAIFLKNLQGQYLLVNQTVCQVFARPLSEILGRSDAELIAGVSADKFQQSDRRALEADSPIECEESLYVPHLDPPERTYLATKFALKDEQGEAYAIGGISTDITDRKRVETRLQLSERALEASSNGIVIVDARQPDFPLIYVNSAFERMTGYPANEVLGSNCRFLQGRDRHQPELERLRRTLRQGDSCTVVLRNYRKDGTFFWNEISISPIEDEQGNIAYYLGIQNDISEAKKSELDRRLAQERLEYLLGSNPGVIYSCSVEDNFEATFMSDNVRSLMGYEPQAFLEDSGFWKNHIHPQDRSRILANMSAVFDKGTHTYEYRFRFADGAYHWVYDQLKLVRDEQGNPVEILGYWNDISDRKRAETELQQARDRLQAVLDAIPGRVSWMRYDPDEDRVFYLGVNPTLANSYHLQPEAFIGRSLDFQDERREFSQFMQDFFHESSLQITREVQLDLCGDTRRYLIVAQKYERSQCAVSVGIDITELKETEEKLKASLHDKDLLLKEVHHRVKNNLQVISSIFSLQSRATQEEKVLGILEESQNRLRTMAIVHEKLYQSKNLSKIDFLDYIKSLANNLFASYNISQNLVHLHLNVEPLFLNLDTATPCGLLVNEMLSNALKHGFPNGQSGEIWLEVFREVSSEAASIESHRDRYVLRVRDTGIGLPEDLEIARSSSLGLRLVRSLTRQLRGTLDMYNENGAVFQVTFSPLPDRQRG